MSFKMEYESDMISRQLGNSSLSVSALGFGAGHIDTTNLNEKTAQDLLGERQCACRHAEFAQAQADEERQERQRAQRKSQQQPASRIQGW